jgi:xanthine dehydrogenase accessory factor
MPDRRAILSLLRHADPVVLMTLVRVAGSSYRQCGARLLLTANGEHAGSLSGGCLEAELQRRAAWRVRAGAVVERYSTLFDDTAEVPFGLGCGGVVDVLL